MTETTPLAEAAAAWDRPGAEVVVLGIVPWSPRWQRPHHFAVELVRRGHRVVYLTPHLLVDRAGWRELPDVARPDGVVLAQLATDTLDSVHRSSAWSHDDLAHAHHQFWQLVRQLRLRCPILLVQSPNWWPLVRWIRERSELPLVYDCLDEHTGWDPEIAERARAWEDELAAEADLVLVSARRLHDRLRQRSSRALLVPNGCDVARFEPCVAPSGVLRRVLDGPIVGYYGAVSPAWVDASLLAAVAELRPDWNVVVIGPTDQASAATLDRCPNVLRLDEVPYAQLPRYCADFHVAVVPFLVNELTGATDPVKVYEYFAAGKPVVATPMPELYRWQGLLTVADTAGGFVAAIDRYLGSPGDVAARQAVAREASWSSRVDRFHPAMLACLPSLAVVVVADGRDPAATVASVEGDPSYRATVTVVEDATQALAEAMAGDEGSRRYLLVLPAGVVVPPGGLLAFAGALARTPGAAAIVGELAEADSDGSPRELAWSRFGAPADTAPAVAGDAPVIVRRRDLAAAAGTSAPGRDLAGALGALGRPAVTFPELLVAPATAGQPDGLDPPVRLALVRRSRGG
jgi:glycosyltransferase involved in cell wall biosynthesis